VPRTLQSSYSELLGLYPPLTRDGISIKRDPSPTLKIRRKEILKGGGFIDTLQLVPVFTMTPGSPRDDVLFAGCQYIWARKSYYQALNETFKDVYEQVVTPIEEPLQKAFDLPPDVMSGFSFQLALVLMDLLTSENFEGDPSRYQFRDEDINYIRLVQKLYLTIPMFEDGR
jgi:hypothetical protein